jgi:hypothetical protein
LCHHRKGTNDGTSDGILAILKEFKAKMMIRLNTSHVMLATVNRHQEKMDARRAETKDD